MSKPTLNNNLIKDIKSKLPRALRDCLLILKSKVMLTKPSMWMRAEEYSNMYDAKWHFVCETMTRYPASCKVNLETRAGDTGIRLAPDYIKDGVLELNSASVYGRWGWVFSKEGIFISDTSTSHQATAHVFSKGIAPRFPPKKRHLKGVGLTIACYGGAHYGHWLIESIPRLDLFRKAGFEFSDVDYILCSKPKQGTPEYLFNQLSIPLHKCVWINKETSLLVDTLLVPSHPGILRSYLPWVTSFLQTSFLESPSPLPYRRLYLSREGYLRNPVNSENVNNILARYNFQTFNPELHPASHVVFSEAAIVVGHTGSAFSGLVFCQPGAKVLELISSDMPWKLYKNIADSAGLEYDYLLCKSTHHRVDWRAATTQYDFYVNEHELEQSLAKMTKE